MAARQRQRECQQQQEMSSLRRGIMDGQMDGWIVSNIFFIHSSIHL